MVMRVLTQRSIEMTNRCSYDSCTKEPKLKGMCNNHYMSAWKAKRPGYGSWQSMKKRCYLKSAEEYYLYGGRGIKVCDAWRNSYQSFIDDMGAPGEGQSIDRIDCNGDYSPENCRWATPKQQSANRRVNRYITIDGVTKCLSDWIEHYNQDPRRVKARIYTLGWDEVRALTT